MNNRHVDRCEPLGASDKGLQAGVFVRDGDIRQFDTGRAEFFFWCHDDNRASDNGSPILIGTQTVEQDVMVVRDLLANCHGDGNCVSDGDWLDELD